MESLEKASQMLHLTCLLIPQQALATLCYLLQAWKYLKSKLKLSIFTYLALISE